MRKTFTILAVVAFATTLLISSCKSHERCPAYGKVGNPTESTAKRI